MTDERTFDPGLQPERTYLAWQRTVLALGLASAVAVRFTAPHIGPIAVIIGVAGLGLAIAGLIGVRLRYRRTHTALATTRMLHAVSAWPIAALAAAAFLLGLLAAFFVLAGIRFTL